MKEIITRLDEIIRLLRNEKEERGKIPHTPLKEKGETRESLHAHARTRERFVKPTVEEVAAHIRKKGYKFDAEEFWNFYESKGWRIGSHVMKSWTSACVTWQKKREREASAPRPSRSAAPRRSDNWLPATDAQRKEFCDGIEG